MARLLQKLGLAAAVLTASCSYSPAIIQHSYSFYVGRGEDKQIAQRGLVIEESGIARLEKLEQFPPDCTRNFSPKEISLDLNVLLRGYFSYLAIRTSITGQVDPHRSILEGLTSFVETYENLKLERVPNPEGIPSKLKEEDLSKFKSLLEHLLEEQKKLHQNQCI